MKELIIKRGCERIPAETCIAGAELEKIVWPCQRMNLHENDDNQKYIIFWKNNI